MAAPLCVGLGCAYSDQRPLQCSGHVVWHPTIDPKPENFHTADQRAVQCAGHAICHPTLDPYPNPLKVCAPPTSAPYSTLGLGVLSA